MTPEVKQRIEQIQQGIVPKGYKKTKTAIVPAEWKESPIGEYIREYTEKTTIPNQYPVLTSARTGLMLQTDYYSNRQVTTEDNVGYNVLPYGYITFRSRSDDGRFRFNENRIIERGIISYFYPVFSFSEEVCHEYVLYLLNFSIYRRMYPYAEGTAQQVLSLKKLGQLKYSLPLVAEQKKIAEILSTQDKAIELQARKIEELKRFKKGCLEKMFPQKGQKVPEKRFPGFTGDWEQRKLEDYLTVSAEKNTGNIYGRSDVLSVSGDYGIVNQIEFQGRSFAGASVSNYGVVQTGDVVYTKSPLNSNPYGIIKTNKGKPGIVSTLYAVYHPKENAFSDFIQVYFEQHARMNNYMHPLVNKGAKNDMKVSAENALKGPVCFPSRIEQKSISAFFSVLDNLITLHQRKLEEMKRQKKALMQLLLTGIVRV